MNPRYQYRERRSFNVEARYCIPDTNIGRGDLSMSWPGIVSPIPMSGEAIFQCHGQVLYPRYQCWERRSFNVMARYCIPDTTVGRGDLPMPWSCRYCIPDTTVRGRRSFNVMAMYLIQFIFMDVHSSSCQVYFFIFYICLHMILFTAVRRIFILFQ